MSSNIQDFYTLHSRFTDPGPYLNYFLTLPASIERLCEIIHGLLVHETDAELFAIIHPPSRFRELSLRPVQKILKHILQLEHSNLEITRAPKKRKIASCRDFAILLVAMCRTLGIPARMRVGFATYTCTDHDFNLEHTLVEYWNQSKQRWVLVDPRLSPLHFQKKRILTAVDFLDVPKTLYMSSGRVWLDCKNGIKNPNHFGFGVNRKYKGLWYIRNRLMHDFAALNKFEMLPWDAWGYMFHEPPHVNPRDPAQITEITELAKKICDSAFSLADLQKFWGKPDLKVPSIVISYDRYHGPNSTQLDINQNI